MVAAADPVAVLVTNLAPAEKLGQAIAVHGSCFLIAQAAGPWLGEFVMESAARFCGLAALTICCSLVFMPLVPNVTQDMMPAGGPKPRAWRQTVGPLLANALFVAGFGVSISFVADYAALLGLRAEASTFFTGWMIGGLAIRFGLGARFDSGNRLRIGIGGGLISAAGLGLLFVVGTGWQFGLAGLLIGTGSSIYAPSLQAIAITRSASRVAAITLFRGTTTLTLAVSSLGGGMVTAWFGYPALFLLTSLLSLAGCVALLVDGKRTG